MVGDGMKGVDPTHPLDTRRHHKRKRLALGTCQFLRTADIKIAEIRTLVISSFSYDVCSELNTKAHLKRVAVFVLLPKGSQLRNLVHFAEAFHFAESIAPFKLASALAAKRVLCRN